MALAGTTLDATVEAGEPPHLDNFYTRSVWYSWISPFSGPVQLTVAGTYVGLEVYTGPTIPTLTRISYGPLDQSISFQADAGQAYQLAVTSYGYHFAPSGTDFTLSISPADVAISSPLAGARFYGPTNLPLHAYVNPVDGAVQRVEFYEGANFLGAATAPPFSMTWSNLVAGDYEITAMSVSWAGITNVSGLVPIIVFPLNDNFADSIAIEGTNSIVFGSVNHASSEAGEPSTPGISVGQSCWWTWTAPKKGTAKLVVGGPSFIPFVNVYSGTDLNGLSLIASNSFQHCSAFCGCQWGFLDTLSFFAEPGHTYQIQVDDTPEFTLHDKFGSPPSPPPARQLAMELRFDPPPRNDDFEHRIRLKGLALAIQGSTLGATKQRGEPDHGGIPGGKSIWYSWRAPASGTVAICTNQPDLTVPPDGSGGDAGWSLQWDFPGCGEQYDSPPLPIPYLVFAVYRGSSLPGLRAIAAGPSVTFDAIAGETYQIALEAGGENSSVVSFSLIETLLPRMHTDPDQKRGGYQQPF